MRFTLDENVHRGLIPFLKQRDHEVIASPKGLSNGKVLAYAVSHKSALVTHDKDFADNSPSHNHNGIILVKILPKRFAFIKSAFERLLSEKSSNESFNNRLVLLFEDRFDDFPFVMKVLKT